MQGFFAALGSEKIPGRLEHCMCSEAVMKRSRRKLICRFNPVDQGKASIAFFNIRTWIRVFLAYLVLFSYSASDLIAADGPPHHFQMSCNNCHESVKDSSESGYTFASLDTDFVGGPSTKVGKVFVDINHACRNCHEMAGKMSHPVGVRMSGKVPDYISLDKDSQITCVSCHDDAKETDGATRNRYFLHQPVGRAFCASCHKRNSNTLKSATHWEFTTKAHLDEGASFYRDKHNDSTSDMNSNNPTGRIDEETRLCLGCHDDMGSVVTQGDYKNSGNSKRQCYC